MKYRMLRWSWLPTAVMAAGLVGCDWESTPQEDSWKDLTGVNVSGLYRASAGGLVVTRPLATYGWDSQLVTGEPVGTGNGVDFHYAGGLSHWPVTPGTFSINAGGVTLVDAGGGGSNATANANVGTLTVAGGAQRVVAEVAEVCNGADSSFSGILSQRPVAAGTLTIAVGGFVLVDDGAGALAGGGKTGTIVYDTGAWSVDLSGSVPAAGTEVLASYQVKAAAAGTIVYSTGQWSFDVGADPLPAGQTIFASYRFANQQGPESRQPGNSGNGIYSFVVVQQGNNLVMTDSSGNEYRGRISEPSGTTDTGVQTTGSTGTGTGTGAGTGTSATGQTGTQEIGTSFPFEVEGSSGGVPVRVSGTFRISVVVFYSVQIDLQTGLISYNELYRRKTYLLQGTWFEASGVSAAVTATGPSDLEHQTVAFQ